MTAKDKRFTSTWVRVVRLSRYGIANAIAYGRKNALKQFRSRLLDLEDWPEGEPSLTGEGSYCRMDDDGKGGVDLEDLRYVLKVPEWVPDAAIEQWWMVSEEAALQRWRALVKARNRRLARAAADGGGNDGSER